MATINISVPTKLKFQAEALIKSGYFVSFSDLVRDALRRLVERSRLDLWIDEAKLDLKKGKAVVLKSDREVDKYLKSL